MLKHIGAIVGLSIAVMLTILYVQTGLQYLVSAHEWLANALKEIFSGGQAGNLIRQLLAMLTIPFVLGLVPAVAYWLARREWFPYFMECVWIVWLVQTSALIVLYKTAGV